MCLQECLFFSPLCFSMLEHKSHGSGRGQLSRHMHKTSGSCMHLLVTSGFLIRQLRVYHPHPHWFYLPGSSWLPDGSLIAQSEGSKYGPQNSEVAVSFWNQMLPECHFLPCLHSLVDGNHGKITGCGVICGNQQSIAIPGCTRHFPTPWESVKRIIMPLAS